MEFTRRDLALFLPALAAAQPPAPAGRANPRAAGRANLHYAGRAPVARRPLRGPDGADQRHRQFPRHAQRRYAFRSSQ